MHATKAGEHFEGALVGSEAGVSGGQLPQQLGFGGVERHCQAGQVVLQRSMRGGRVYPDSTAMMTNHQSPPATQHIHSPDSQTASREPAKAVNSALAVDFDVVLISFCHLLDHSMS